ncbi:MAG: glycoside hydrolase family 5 protein [Oscillospiraceae bacterium]|nr:glycoside hydrolase family 5 protein [Oscillospiraceae bacterium]
MFKKYACVITAAAMMLSIMTSCGSSENETASGSAEASSAVTTAVTEENYDEKLSSMTSAEIVEDMTFGWNLGDTLDVCNADRDGDGEANETADVVDETLWGNPQATAELFKSLKDDGINAVRIPVTWRDHLDKDNNIDSDWMDRVQEVVDYAYSLDMYVIINVHHDGGDDEKFGAWVRKAADDYDSFYERYSSIWNQICDRFGDYSERLIFESMNEVGFDNLNQAEAYELLNKINQDFVDLVRSSGKRNDTRHLLIAGYWTDIRETCSPLYKLPDDPAGRCIVSVHYYTPWQFCITGEHSTWGTDEEIKEMESLVGKLSDTFCSNGIPVIVGEYAASGSDKASCVDFIERFVSLCKQSGIAVFYWDNGSQIDRNTYEWRDPEFLEAMQRAAA